MANKFQYQLISRIFFLKSNRESTAVEYVKNSLTVYSSINEAF